MVPTPNQQDSAGVHATDGVARRVTPFSWHDDCSVQAAERTSDAVPVELERAGAERNRAAEEVVLHLEEGAVGDQQRAGDCVPLAVEGLVVPIPEPRLLGRDISDDQRTGDRVSAERRQSLGAS